ncbi:type IVB secretion system protein IcmH/DotU [Utexia brackfieldae]|uniref:type IVB secretion system protein IcmH/DotU n=1 Tax=Utexia brackfieldae TaxID=3074108 RepID=UPI00370D2620
MATPKLHHSAGKTQQYVNQLEQYTLPLSGNNLNPIVDAATPLLGMILRIQDLSTPIDDPDHLYRQIVTDIQNISQQLEMQGYEPGSIVTFRYVLCSFIDECIMGSEPMLGQFWSHKSLLIHFHNEGWGGERVFQITERLMNEPKRYQAMLEFIYLCFGLGFRGRYKVQHPNSDEFEQLFRRLNTLLTSLNGEPPSTRLHLGQIQAVPYYLTRAISKKHIIWGAIGILAFAYSLYLFSLNSQTADILTQLNQLLK